MDKKRILFVDDEPNVLEGLERMLHSMRDGWDMAFASGGQEALELLDKEPFDVVVSDMRMPGMDGAQLLGHVMKNYPSTIRVILSGYSDYETILRSIGPTHQYLCKPCDAETLKAAIARACAIRDRMADESLRQLVSRMRSLPSLPSLYTEVVKELQSPGASLKKVGDIISKDVGMTAKILQLVNSAFFGVATHVSSPARAVALLGLDTVKALVLSIEVFSEFERAKSPGFPLDALWRHSVAVGAFARRISQTESQDQKTCDDALMAGLLHDCGKLVLAVNLPEQYREAVSLARGKNIALVEAESEILGVTHADVGAYLLGLWGLPDPIVEAIAFYHCPTECVERAFSPLTAVHVANVLEHETGSSERIGAAAQVDQAYLAELGLAGQLPMWRRSCRAIEEDGSQ